ncbi:hypothetical protein E4M02_11190 [Brevundimonas sp. S30B]|uniref:hypothetical protein n=1 Tax=unclassified Brevundimonas TaxID=2622653 RepID=UPI0010729635|nr:MULTISPECIES: hypothetical protein [unclassified Brevundimonas]QBX38679.1 hypothetical protein E4M01_13450 [Brevundimonas sp. MF30-B]TFW01270.1 hypothetical protein E4M02_11190 [Brevundimonas sp. S30B]
MEDVTDQFDDVNEYDRLFRTPQGYLAKVRVEDISANPTVVSFKVTGSWADDATGKAKPFGQAWFIVEPHEVTARPDTPVDLPALIEDARERVALRVEAAAVNHEAVCSLPGVKAKAVANPSQPAPMAPPGPLVLT